MINQYIIPGDVLNNIREYLKEKHVYTDRKYYRHYKLQEKQYLWSEI